MVSPLPRFLPQNSGRIPELVPAASFRGTCRIARKAPLGRGRGAVRAAVSTQDNESRAQITRAARKCRPALRRRHSECVTYPSWVFTVFFSEVCARRRLPVSNSPAPADMGRWRSSERRSMCADPRPASSTRNTTGSRPRNKSAPYVWSHGMSRSNRPDR